MHRADFSELLGAAGAGDAQAAAALYSLVYDELRLIARRHLRGGGDAGAPGATSLVHEAYMRLARCDPAAFTGSSHFLSTASRTMRHILIDHARRRASEKRGGAQPAITLAEQHGVDDGHDVDVLALDAAIEALARVDPPLAQLVEWRFFGGLTVPEIAAASGQSATTVKRDLREASAFLRRHMQGEGG